MGAISPSQSLLDLVQTTKVSARLLAKLSSPAKNQALEAIAIALEAHADEILVANQKDVQAAQTANLATPLINRLKLDAGKLAAMVTGVRDVIRLDDPVGIRQIHRELDTNLILERLTCPLGVVGVIFEARPDAVTQISALAIKSGNGIILKGGSEAVRSCEAIVNVIHQALSPSLVPVDAVRLLTTRAETLSLLQMDKEIDLIIPRGSNEFVRYIQENTHIPVLGHAEGICHLYVDAHADIDQAVAIAVDSKTQYPAACNAIETLLVHEGIALFFLPLVIRTLQASGVEIRGCDRTLSLLKDSPQHQNRDLQVVPATDTDWSTEYSDLVLSVRIVSSIDVAINHINTYGSRHTEAIVTQDPEIAAKFLSEVDAAGVYHNCSTRFADGFRYGFGAEVGISTQKMPPRGPVGLEGLITYKYQVKGQGHIVAPYTGAKPQKFTHRDLDS